MGAKITWTKKKKMKQRKKWGNVKIEDANKILKFERMKWKWKRKNGERISNERTNMNTLTRQQQEKIHHKIKTTCDDTTNNKKKVKTYIHRTTTAIRMNKRARKITTNAHFPPKSKRKKKLEFFFETWTKNGFVIWSNK